MAGSSPAMTVIKASLHSVGRLSRRPCSITLAACPRKNRPLPRPRPGSTSRRRSSRMAPRWRAPRRPACVGRHRCGTGAARGRRRAQQDQPHQGACLDVQNADAALLLDGHVELVARSGADGAHVSDIEFMNDALEQLKPDRIVGVGGLHSRHDSMLAGEAGADYVLFGEPEATAKASHRGDHERLEWWAELFEPPASVMHKHRTRRNCLRPRAPTSLWSATRSGRNARTASGAGRCGTTARTRSCGEPEAGRRQAWMMRWIEMKSVARLLGGWADGDRAFDARARGNCAIAAPPQPEPQRSACEKVRQRREEAPGRQERRAEKKSEPQKSSTQKSPKAPAKRRARAPDDPASISPTAPISAAPMATRSAWP